MNDETMISDLALRIVCAFTAAVILGINFGEKGRIANLRSILSLSLATCLGVILFQVIHNLDGRSLGVFSAVENARLPLGVLAGIGFLGAGIILHRGDLFLGLLTGAAFWFTLMMGLSFGAGEIALGWSFLGVSFVALWGLEKMERQWKHHHKATLVFDVAFDGPSVEDLLEHVRAFGYEVSTPSITSTPDEEECRCHVYWEDSALQPTDHPAFLDHLSREGLINLEWRPIE